MAATTASDYLHASADLVNRLPISEDGVHLRVVTSTSLKVGDFFAVLLFSEGFGWEGRLAGPAQIGADEVFEGNAFIWMRVLHTAQAGMKIVGSLAGPLPSTSDPDVGIPASGMVVFSNIQRALVPHQWFQDSLVETGGVTIGRKRAADGPADGALAAARGPSGSGIVPAGESAASPARDDTRCTTVSVRDLDGNNHDPHASGVTAERLENLQFLLRVFDLPRRDAFISREYLFRGDRLLERAFGAPGAGGDSGPEGPTPGLSVLPDLRRLPFMVGGAGEGSLLHGFLHGGWKVDDWAAGCFLDFVTADRVLTADYLEGEGSDDARAVFVTALQNFERFLCALLGASFSNLLAPLREALEVGERWSRFDNVLVARNIHVMFVRWMSDVHQRKTSTRFPLDPLKTPADCAALLTQYILDFLAGALERREVDDWCVGGHVDFYREDRGRYWFIHHPKIGGLQLRASKPKKVPKPPAQAPASDPPPAAAPAPAPGSYLMRDGQRSVCALHICGAIFYLKVRGRDGKEVMARCPARGKDKCRFWHPSQLSQMTRSQALSAVGARNAGMTATLAGAAAAAVNASGIIWKAEPVKREAGGV
jgi:hypothetical protein